MPTDALPDNPALALAVAALTGQRDMRLITRPTICHGYANTCKCPDCLERLAGRAGPFSAPERIRQPWEVA